MTPAEQAVIDAARALVQQPRPRTVIPPDYWYDERQRLQGDLGRAVAALDAPSAPGEVNEVQQDD